MGSIRIRESNLWKAPVEAWIRDAGVWKPAKEIWFRYTGNWVQLFGEPPGAIGDEYAGGYYFGEFSETQDGNATHYLVVCPKANVLSVTSSLSAIGFPSTDLGDGPTSSAALATFGFQPAIDCENAFINGYSDWYLGAIKEYEILYYNLKPNSVNNNTTSGFGDNPYAVPSRAGGAYTSTVPALTTAPLFTTGGSQQIEGTLFLSSSSTGGNIYIFYLFSNSSFNGRQNIATFIGGGTSFYYPIRRVPI